MMKGVTVIIMMMSLSLMSFMSLTVYAFSSSSFPFPHPDPTTSHKNRATIVNNGTISQIPVECVPSFIQPGFGDIPCGQNYPLPPFHIRMLIENNNLSLASQGYTEVKFRVPANISNVYFSVAAEVVGNNFTGTAGINAQLYDITECHKTITPTDLQPDGQCGISYLDAKGMSAMNGSFGHIRLPAGRNYILVLTNPADGPVQISDSAYITYTYLNNTHGEGK
jgi:hypothetical protein